MKWWKRIQLRWVVVVYYTGSQVYTWQQFLTLNPGHSRTPPQIIVPAVAEIVTALLVAGWVILRYRSLMWVFAATVNAVVLLVGNFSIWYVSYGTVANWYPKLTRLDGLALTIGTLTTAGAPGVAAHSELARRLITVQLLVDILAAIVLFGLLAGRLASRAGATAQESG